MNGKKILYVASSIGHINNFHLPYIEALRAEGNEVLVMARGAGADFDIPFEKKLVSSKNGECRRKIREIIDRERFDAVILNTSLAAFHVRLALRRNKRPRVVNIVHGYLFSRDTGVLKTALLLLSEKLVGRKTDAIIVMNRDDFEIAKRHRLTRGKVYFSRGMGASVRPVVTSPERIRSEFFSEGDFVMTFVGELSARKNQRFLIEALPKIKERIPNARLCLVGDGGERAALEELSAALGVSGDVVFTGARADACDFLRASDLYVSASRIEGMPFNIIEALGVGMPVLASDIKGQSDLIENGECGYLYKFGDMSEFVNKTCQIYEKNELSAEKIKNKYLKYEKNSVFPETLSLIKETLELD